VVILNASKTGCAALILTPTGVQHVPLPQSTFTEMIVLVKLLQNAISSDARCSSLPESVRACVEGLVQQMPTRSDTLRSLRLLVERHLGRASDNSLQPDDIFRYALGVLWESVVEPVIHVLGLKVNRVLLQHLTYLLTYLPLLTPTVIYRKPTSQQSCGGAPLDRSRSSQYTQQGYTLPRRQKASLITLFRRTHRPLVSFSATFCFLLKLSR